jgi:hypothetical protein
MVALQAGLLASLNPRSGFSPIRASIPDEKLPSQLAKQYEALRQYQPNRRDAAKVFDRYRAYLHRLKKGISHRLP